MTKRGRPRKWKRCPTCQRDKLIESDFYHWTDKGRPRLSAHCKDCIRERRRERYYEVVADPYLAERLRKRQNTWALRGDQRENVARCKRYREKLKVERPEVYQQQLEDARIRGRLRNEDRPLGTKRAVVVEPRAARLPVTPLIDFLNRVAVDDEAVVSDDTARAVRRALHDNHDHVSVLVADRIVTAYGGALSAVYPELFP
jgi:hypothetical protein